VRAGVLHDEHLTGTELASALGACPRLDRVDHQQVRWRVLPLKQALTLALDNSGEIRCVRYACSIPGIGTWR
jgi:hypothetical protein